MGLPLTLMICLLKRQTKAIRESEYKKKLAHRKSTTFQKHFIR
jgi:hypothetical protein